MEYNIRAAKNSDHLALLVLMKAHAEYEGHSLAETAQHQKLAMIESLPVTLFVVCLDEQLVGYMSVIKQYSTWDLDWYYYLDCLYLTKETRGQGLGGKLMHHLKGFAKERGIDEVQWQTPHDNFGAIEFYQKLGGVNKMKQRFFWPI